jgi:hypothetical protein
VSGESVVAVGAVTVGTVALLGFAAGASCAFIVGHGLEALGSQLERREMKREAERSALTEWNGVLQDVALRNGRIGVLRAALADAGRAGQVTLPPPLVLGTQTLPDLRQWCADTDRRLARAEGGVVELTAQAILRRAASLAATAEVRTGFDAPDDQPGIAAAAASPGVPPGEAMRADIVRVASRLRPGATAGEREAIAQAATRVLTARSRIDARNRLADMRVRVDRANEAAPRRVEQATEAARLLQPLAHADAEETRPLREELLRVVAGSAPLTGTLRERACQAAADLQRTTDRGYVRTCVTESLAELGYAVDEGFQTAVVKDGVLQVTHGDWNAHGVRMVFDGDKQEVRAAVVRTQDGGRDANRVDAEREKQWCAAQEKLKVMLAAKNVTFEIRSRTEPGTRPVHVLRKRPAASAAAATPAAAPRVNQA